ncbi:MAG: hypothetical protein AAGU32_18070, partial [Bacillota bacterium]
MCREFCGYRKYPKGAYQTPECASWEIRRAIYDVEGHNPRAYYMGLYRQCETRWIATAPCSASCGGSAEGRVYGKTLPTLARSELRRTGLVEMLSFYQITDPEKYLAVLEKVPQLEQIVKAGLFRLANECLEGYHNFHGSINSEAGGSLAKILGINAQELGRLRQNNGGRAFLRWLQVEKAFNK